MTLAIELATRKYVEKNTNSITGKNICPIFLKVGIFREKTAISTGEELFPKSAEQLNFFIEAIRRPNGPKLGWRLRRPLALEGHQREENLDASLGKANAKAQAQKGHLLTSRTLQHLDRKACFGLNPLGEG